jgi:uncharacterized protein
MKFDRIYCGDRNGCKQAMSQIQIHYVYILRRPDGRPFYVGKGIGPRVFDHENEARHPNDRRSNAHKLNLIRSLWRAGEHPIYEIESTHSDESAAYLRETDLIAHFGRLHEGGPLTNRAPGGGAVSGPSPFSREKHGKTLGGIPDDDPETAIFNRFVLAIGRMESVVLKPRSRFIARPTLAHPSKRSPSLRQAVALAATAAANGIVLQAGARLPRSVVIEDVEGFVENGVSCDIAKSGLATVIDAAAPTDEVFMIDAGQARTIINFIGQVKAQTLGLIP